MPDDEMYGEASDIYDALGVDAARAEEVRELLRALAEQAAQLELFPERAA